MSSKTKTTAMKEEAKPALVPKLRFPGFTAPWAYEPLSKVLREHKLKNTEGRDVFSVSMEYGIVNQIELLGRSFAAADTSHYTIGRCYDVVYTKSPLKAFPFGIVKQCKFDGEVALSPLYGVFTPTNPHLGLMIEAFFESPNRSKDFLSPLCQKGAKNTLQITNTTFLSGCLPLPPKPAEQRKIAECLSSVDEVIAAQARKLDALKTHKKGLMQKLFPPAKDSGSEEESENLEVRSKKKDQDSSFSIQNSQFSIPKLRFPEFQNAGEWDSKPLGGLGEIITGKTPSTKESGLWGGDILFITPTDISEKDKYQHTTARTVVVTKSTKVLPAGSIVYTCIASIGKMALTVIPSITNQQINAVVPNKRALGEFLYYALANLTPWIKTIPATNTLPIINKTDFSKIAILHPEDKDEQQRIASCLSSLDALITAETQKHEALKTHKKGLMQKLFPSSEEFES